MNNNCVTHIPSGQMALTGQRRQMTGMGISFLIHAIVLFALLSMKAALPDIQPPLVIDFSLEKAFEAHKVQKTVVQETVVQEIVVQKLFAQAEEQQEQVVTEIEPIPLPEEIAPEPTEIIEITEQIEIEKPVPQQEPIPEIAEVVETVEPEPEPPVLQPFVEKQVVVIRELTPRLLKKKIVAKKKKPKQANPVKTPSRAVKEIARKQEVSNTAPANTVSNKPILAKTTAPIAAPQRSKPAIQPKAQYVKEHFLYIKDRVQNKITYPRIARKMGWQGRVLISFTICRDGSVKDIRIVESSGFKALDNNAVKIIQRVAPFPKPPVSAELTIPVIYKLS
jgi:protein TonB